MMTTNMKTVRYLIVGACLSAATMFSTGAFAEAKFHFNAGSSASKHANKNYERKHRSTGHRHRDRRSHYNYRYWHGTHPSYYGHRHGYPSSGVGISYHGSINSRSALSLAAFAFVVGGLDYYFDDGYYYHHTHGRYHRVHAPIGARIHHLPRGYSRVTIGHTHYYTYRDVYYTWDRHNRCYTVVANPYYDRHDHTHDHNHQNHDHAYDRYPDHEHGDRDNHRHSHNDDDRDGYSQRNERPRSQAQPPAQRHSHSSSSREPRSAIAVEQNKRYDCHIAATKVADYDPTKDPYSVYKSKKYTNAHTTCLSKNGLVVR